MWNECRSIVILFSAFTFLFAIMEPVPWQLKIAFHFFGFGSLILGMVLFASTFASELCVSVFFLLFFYGNLRVKKYSLTRNNSNLLGRPKKVWVIRNSSARQITGNRERSKWIGRECKYHALSTSKAALDDIKIVILKNELSSKCWLIYRDGNWIWSGVT